MAQMWYHEVKIRNMFNDFFTNTGINLAENIPNATHDRNYYLRRSFVDSMYLSPVTVSSLIKNLKSSAAGWYELANESCLTLYFETIDICM